LYHVASGPGHLQGVRWTDGPTGSLASHCFWEISEPFRKGKNEPGGSPLQWKPGRFLAI